MTYHVPRHQGLACDLVKSELGIPLFLAGSRSELLPELNLDQMGDFLEFGTPKSSETGKIVLGYPYSKKQPWKWVQDPLSFHSILVG